MATFKELLAQAKRAEEGKFGGPLASTVPDETRVAYARVEVIKRLEAEADLGGVSIPREWETWVISQISWAASRLLSETGREENYDRLLDRVRSLGGLQRNR